MISPPHIDPVSKDRDLKLLMAAAFALLFMPFVKQYGYESFFDPNTDLPSFYWASVLAFHLQESPYGEHAFATVERQSGQHIFPFLYPPCSLLMFYPLSRLSYNSAKGVLLLINHATIVLLFLWMVLILFRSSQRSASPAAVILPVYLVTFYPIVPTLNHGQINLVVAVLFCIFWYAMKRDSSAPLIAVPLAMAILLKTYPAVILPFLFIKGRNRVILWTVSLIVLAAILSFLVLPRGAWPDWFTTVLPSGGYGQAPKGLFSPAARWNQSINGFTARLFLPSSFSSPVLPDSFAGRCVPYVLSVCVVLFTFIVSYRATRRLGNQCLDMEFSLVLLAMFLVAPFSWEHHLVLVLPAIVSSLVAIWDGTIRANAARLLILSAAVVLAWPIPVHFEQFKQGILTLAISIKFFAVLTLWLVLLLQLQDKIRSESAARESVVCTTSPHECAADPEALTSVSRGRP